MASATPAFSIRWATLKTGDAAGERLPLLCWKGPRSIPDPHIARYILAALRPSVVPNTIEAMLYGIGRGLIWCQERRINLVERAVGGSMLTSVELSVLANHMRRGSRVAAVDRTTAAIRYSAFISYVLWIVEPAVQRIARTQDRVVALRGLEAFRKAAHAVRPKRPGPAAAENPGKVGMLTPTQRELFLRVIVPGAPENPFRADLQARNYAYLLVAFTLPVRAGELQSLKVRDIKFSSDPATMTIHRRHDDPDDKRRRSAAVKTRARVFELEERTRKALYTWIMDVRRDRDVFPNAAKGPYVFVNEDGDAITAHGISSMFQTLRTAHPSLPSDLTTHFLRADWNCRWVKLVDDEAKELRPEDRLQHNRDSRDKQIYMNGWSDQSKMPEHYAKAMIRALANDKNLKHQRMILGKENAPE